MVSPTLSAALARLDDLDATLATLRLLADAYTEDGEDAGHVAEYFSFAVGDAASDLAVLAEARQPDVVTVA